MEERIITDTDFVPEEHVQLDSYDEVYQIEYEILSGVPDFNRTHDNIVRLVKNRPSQLSRKAMLVIWQQELNKIVTALKSFYNKKFETIVYIPITLYRERIETTLQQFEFAKILIGELVQDPNQVDRIVAKDNSRIPNIYELFAETFENFCDTGNGLPVEDVNWNRKVIVDEMLRRGLYDYGRLDKLCHGRYVTSKDFVPSEHYDEKERFFEVFYEDKEHLEKADIDKLMVGLTEEQLREEDNRKVKCGVMYYILRDKLDTYSLAAIINYACRVPYNNKVKKANTNSVEKYLRLYKKHDMNPENSIATT